MLFSKLFSIYSGTQFELLIKYLLFNQIIYLFTDTLFYNSHNKLISLIFPGTGTHHILYLIYQLLNFIISYLNNYVNIFMSEPGRVFQGKTLSAKPFRVEPFYKQQLYYPPVDSTPGQ